MRATQVVHWTPIPSLAISADGHVVATNEACDRLLGNAPEALNGMRCWDVVKATDAAGARVCRPTDCPTLAALAAGDAPDLGWSGWLLECGEVLPVQASAIAVPPDERDDRAAAVILLHVEPPEGSDARAEARAMDGDAGEPARSGTRIHLLGRPECWRDGERQAIPRRRVFELLALLALAGEAGCTRQFIVDTLWPEAPRGNGRQHLRVLLHTVRRVLGPDCIEAVHPHPDRAEYLRLGSDAWVDLTAFEAGARIAPVASGACDAHARAIETASLERLEEMIALYRGDLDELGEFGGWIAPHRERLRGQFLALLAEAIPVVAARGRIDDAIAYCRHAIEVDPLEERFWVALLTTYGRLGRRSAAVALYQDYRRMLARELGLEPSFAFERAFREAMGSREPPGQTVIRAGASR